MPHPGSSSASQVSLLSLAGTDIAPAFAGDRASTETGLATDDGSKKVESSGAATQNAGEALAPPHLAHCRKMEHHPAVSTAHDWRGSRNLTVPGPSTSRYQSGRRRSEEHKSELQSLMRNS